MSVTTESSEEMLATARAAIGDSGSPQVARHPVTETAIADWCDAMGDANPCYLNPEYAATSVHRGLVAPPAMLDNWDRPGLPATRAGDDPRSKVIAMLEAQGFVSVVAVNSDLEFRRYVRPGELLQNVQILDEVSEEKTTGLGVGHFVTTRHRFTTSDGEHVGDLRFRILKFRPGTGRTPPAPEPGARPPIDPDPARRPRPAINRDNQYFWDGARGHELRIQRCTQCQATYFPPTPRCPQCGGFDMGYTVASGRGRLYSFAIPHYPQVNGFRYPVNVGLVELAEGTRLVSNIVGCRAADLYVGMPLELTWLDSHPAQEEGATDSRGPIAIPQFRPAPPPRQTETRTVGQLSQGERLPLWALPVTPTLIVSGALATRDFQEVHHDQDLAVQRGSKDLFMNINTSVGLLQRFVSDWAGPQALFRAIRVRLGAPNYPYDTMTFTGDVQTLDPASGEATIAVKASNSLGDHVTGTAEILLPGGSAYPGETR